MWNERLKKNLGFHFWLMIAQATISFWAATKCQKLYNPNHSLAPFSIIAMCWHECYLEQLSRCDVLLHRTSLCIYKECIIKILSISNCYCATTNERSILFNYQYDSMIYQNSFGALILVISLLLAKLLHFMLNSRHLFLHNINLILFLC
jgi:hypothetical protein